MSLSREEFYSEAETKHHACCCITFPSKQEKIEKALEKAGWQKLGEGNGQDASFAFLLAISVLYRIGRTERNDRDIPKIDYIKMIVQIVERCRC